MESVATGEVRYLDYGQATRRCGLSRWSILRAVRSGHLVKYGSERSPRFKVEELDSWVEAGAPTA